MGAATSPDTGWKVRHLARLHTIFPDAACAVPLIDRPTHHSPGPAVRIRLASRAKFVECTFDPSNVIPGVIGLEIVRGSGSMYACKGGDSLVRMRDAAEVSLIGCRCEGAQTVPAWEFLRSTGGDPSRSISIRVHQAYRCDVVVANIERLSFLRRVWIVYKWLILFLTIVAGAALTTLSDHRLITPAFTVGLLLAVAGYWIIHTRKASKSLSGELHRRGMSAVRVQIISLLLAAADMICMVVIAIVRWPPGALGHTIGVIMGLAFPCILIAGFVSAARRLHAGSLVLWLRRFHGRPMRGFSFPAVLGLACSGVATPITLQDDTFRQSWPVGTYRALHPRVFLIEFLGMVASAVTLMLLLTSLLESVSLPLAGLIALPIVGLGYFALSHRHCRSLGAFSVSRNLDRELPVLLHSLSADRRRVAGMAGVIVIGVPDESWRKAVLMTMARCALVIIDLSDPSENLEWELSTAVTTLSPERVVIACARTDQQSEDVARHFMGQTLLRAVAPELVSRLRVFSYPEGLGKSRLFVPQDPFVNELHIILQKILSQRSSAPR